MSVSLVKAGQVKNKTIYWIIGSNYKNGTLLATFNLSNGATHIVTERDAEHLLASYVMSLINQGGSATYNRTTREYRVAMPDGSVEYINPPQAIAN